MSKKRVTICSRQETSSVMITLKQTPKIRSKINPAFSSNLLLVVIKQLFMLINFCFSKTLKNIFWSSFAYPSLLKLICYPKPPKNISQAPVSVIRSLLLSRLTAVSIHPLICAISPKTSFSLKPIKKANWRKILNLVFQQSALSRNRSNGILLQCSIVCSIFACFSNLESKIKFEIQLM